MHEILDITKVEMLLKSIYRVNVISIKIPTASLAVMEKSVLKFPVPNGPRTRD